jgi:hypothetical protein
MAITIDWATRIISVPKADLTLISGAIYELDLDVFRLALKDLEDGAEGMVFPDTHRHNTEVVLGGLTYARIIELINGYTVTFEDGMYAVNLVGANSNVAEKTNVNQVSVRSANSAGLIVVTQGSGLSTAQDERLLLIEQILRNRRLTDQADGKLKILTDDDLAVLLEGLAFEDAAGTQAYRGRGVERVNRLESP